MYYNQFVRITRYRDELMRRDKSREAVLNRRVSRARRIGKELAARAAAGLSNG